jgi:hypothetical protein
LTPEIHLREIIRQRQAGRLHGIVQGTELIDFVRFIARSGRGDYITESLILVFEENIIILVFSFAEFLDQFSGLIPERSHLGAGPNQDEQQEQESG